MNKKLAPATQIFLDLFQVKPGSPGLRLLEDVAVEFSQLPWENLTKFLKKDAAPQNRLRRAGEVMEDHARMGTGGTCFSLTDTLRAIVGDLGFHACPAMADMRHGPNIHCGLVVHVGERRVLLDPGYLVPEPVPLEPGTGARVELPGHRLEYRPAAGCDQYELYTVNDRGEETFRYRLRPGPVREEDFLGFWTASFQATGMNGLHLNRLTSGGRLSAHNQNLRIDDGRRKRNVKLKDSYVETVARTFGLAPELVRQAHEAWCRNR